MKIHPFIHLFSCGSKFYLFDVNTDKILQIPENVYAFIKENEIELENIEDDFIREYIKNLINRGFLKQTYVEETEHPETKYLSSYLKSKVSSMVLQITQNCNLRCDYCVYSGSYYNRVHTNKRMNFETAKKAIDFLINHSSDSPNISIGFYGGEPLLEFELIQKCIQYAHTRGFGKKIYFNMTTNGTLVTKEMMEYFSKYNMHILFSLDGPKEIHDLSRRDVTNQGSYKKLMDTLKMIKEEFPLFFKDKIAFNVVLNPERGYSCISDYVSGEKMIENIPIYASLISSNNIKKKRGFSEEYLREFRYEHFLLLLSKLNEISSQNLSPLSKLESRIIDELRINKNVVGPSSLPKKYHHGGPCIPGSQKLFVNVDGELFPCERVSENVEFHKIGDIENGFDLSKVTQILNIEKLTEKRCHKCWVYNYCHLCVADMSITSEFNEEVFYSERCFAMKKEIEERFKDYCVLKKYGYQY